jgi:hypothetical protein
MKKYFSILLLTLYFSTLTSYAHAYLDPGTGSMIVQIVIAGTVGALFTLKTFWSQIKNFS